jgi:phosphoribosyl 1,2-cyclic phosphate phosphodiesterase
VWDGVLVYASRRTLVRVTSHLTFLGSGDSQGVPRWWCECEVCAEARSTGLNARTRPSALLEIPTDRGDVARVLIDATPEFRMQATRAGLRDLEALITTHAHNDHILGLGDVMDYVRRTNSDTRVYAAPTVLPQLEQRFPYLFQGRFSDRFHPIPEAGLELHGWRVRAFEVPHGFNGASHALRFDRAGESWVYASDCLDLSDETLERWFQRLELLVLGATFWNELHVPRAGRSVYDVRECLELTARIQPQRVVLTHLGHGVDARRKKELPHDHALAQDGLKLKLW